MDFPVFRQLVDWHFGNSIGCPVLLFHFLIYVVESQRGHRLGSGSVQQVTNCVAVCDCWADPGLDMVEQPAKEVTYKRNFKLPSWGFNTFLGVSHCPIWLVTHYTSLQLLNWPWSEPNGGSHMAANTVSPIHALLREFQIPMGFPYFPDRGPRTHIIISRDFLLF